MRVREYRSAGSAFITSKSRSTMNSPSRFRSFFWQHPEWWSLALSALAWSVLLRPHIGFRHHQYPHTSPRFAAVWSGEVLWWMVMVIAMMWPLIGGRVRATAVRSFGPRRARAVVVFMFGYVAVWLTAGVIVTFLILCVRSHRSIDATFLFIVFMLAAAWQLTPYKELALRLCHRTIPLSPQGWRADHDCLRYGWIIGGSCLLSCGFLMAACTVSGHNLAAMLGTGAIGFVERYSFRPNHRILAGAIAVVAVTCVLTPR